MRPLLVGLVVLANAVLAEDEYFSTGRDAAKYGLIVVGAAAEPDYVERFANWGRTLEDILVKEYGYRGQNVVMVGFTPEEGARPGGTRSELQRALNDLAVRMQAGDQLTIVLIGHGTSYADTAKYNLVGPDISGEQLAAMLGPFAERDLIVINTTSGSYLFTQALAGPRRVLVSATRSRAERYDTMFAEVLIEALQNHSADRDKNGRVSVFEAYRFASQSVTKWYKGQGRLISEHATLDDNGDGFLNEVEEEVSQHDGRIAQVAFFDSVDDWDMSLPEPALVARGAMVNLERDIILLKNAKQDMDEAEYYDELERLLIELAENTRTFGELVPDVPAPASEPSPPPDEKLRPRFPADSLFVPELAPLGPLIEPE